MRLVLLVAARELRSRLRDRSALITVFLAPLSLALILSLALGDVDDFAPVIAVAGPGGELLATALETGARGPGEVELRPLADAEEIRGALADERVQAGIVFGAAGGPPLVLRRHDSPLSGVVAQAIAQTAAGLGAGAPRALPLVFESAPRVSSADYYGPSMAVFFAFFITAFAPLSLLAERQGGTLARIAASPAPLGTVLAGKGVAVLVLTLASTAAVWAVTAGVFGASWGHPLGVVLLMVALALAATGVTTMVAARASSLRQAESQTALLTFVGALLGGNFIALADLPDPLRTASLFTPNGWALRGFVDLTAGLSPRVVLPAAGVLLLFSLCAFAIAATGVRTLRVRGA